MWRRLLLLALAAAIDVESSRAAAAAAAEPTTIALTATVRSQAAEPDRQLAENLLALIELGVQADPSLAVVERRRIDLAIQELVLDRSRRSDARLQLGKLVTADLLAMLELLERPPDSPNAWGMLRVVDAKTAAVRGVTVARLDAALVDETAEQFSRYIAAVHRAPQARTVTVAVAPFESQGRFDRLRPLELGLRDLISMRLLLLSGALAGKDNAPLQQPPRFQVLQRSNLEQLLQELDLIQSGLSDKDRLPKTLPTRQASYLIRGQVDERQVDSTYAAVVRGELVHAASARVEETFDFECPPAELEARLATHVDRLVKRFVQDAAVAHPSQVTGRFEVRSLKDLVLTDLRRFRRLSPTDFGYREFRLPGEDTSRGITRLAKPETPLGRHLLRKSIDRLESILYIRPDDAEAAYALGFCYSLHEDGVYRPDRTDALLRKAHALQPQGELGALALAVLGELAFHDRTGRIDPAERNAAVERLWFAFERTPEAYRDYRWPRILDVLAPLYRHPDQNAALAGLLAKATPYAAQAADKHRQQLGGAVQSLAVKLVRQSPGQPELRAQGMDLLQRWAQGEDKQLANFGRQGLAAIRAGNKDFLGAAIELEESAAKLADQPSPAARHKYDWQLVQAATNYRLAQQPDRALRLLRSLEATTTLASLLVGRHGYEIGACYEALGAPERARVAYLQAAEACPAIVPNSDIVQRIKALGGVPLRQDRDVDVRYLNGADNQPVVGKCLATDGKRLYLGGSRGLFAFHPAGETWEPLHAELGPVTCLKCSGGVLWVGTEAKGLWRGDLGSHAWTRFATAEGLPDLHVESLAVHGEDVYLGVGTKASGGLVRIDSEGRVRIFSEDQAPRVAPTHVVVTNQTLLARTLEAIHEWSFETKRWSRHPADPNRRPVLSPRLFAGSSGIWASNYGRELTRWAADEDANAMFQPAWYAAVGSKAGYLVEFVAERGDEVWFGGQPWELFTSSGLYRFHLKTGAFHKFTSADGFLTCSSHSIHDGLWLQGQLWLATEHGLCVARPRPRVPD